jgi:peptidoglycan hydrolase-like amidase
MSQNGARILAEQGMNCEEILTFYYAGMHLARLDEIGYD